VSLVVPKDAQKTAGGLTSGELRFNLTIADLNADQTVSAPKNARPLSELQQALSVLQGGGSANSSTGSGTSAPPASTAPAAATGSPKYLECVQKAGTDIAKVQGCAALVNGG
jgi:hypothetical protein